LQLGSLPPYPHGYENKNQLEVPSVFAGLFCVILIGPAVENLVFRNIELRTVRRWGMQA